jgi:uncharacterized protein
VGPQARVLPEGLQLYVAALVSAWGSNLVSVVLFGSWARGQAQLDSDVDLLIVANTLPRSRLERFRLWYGAANEVSRELARRLAVILLTRDEARETRAFYLDLVEEGVLLHDRDRFFTGVLERLRQRLAVLGAKRVKDRDGHPYWVLKEGCTFGEVIEL